MSDKKVFLFAAGGSGGHIFPAIALAEQVLEKLPEAEIHFVGTERGLESKIIPQINFPLHSINIGQLNKNVGLFRRLKTLFLLPWAFVQSLLLIIKLKPQVVIGVGSYASGPVLLIASLLKRPTFIWEPNAFPGMANRYLAPFVDKAFVVFEEASKRMKARKLERFGYPLRKIISPTELEKSFTSPLKIFIFGGSQGARAINNVFLELYKDKEFLSQDIEFVHQTGTPDYDKILRAHNALPENIKSKIKIFEFIQDMPKYYQWAQIAVCRSGMGSASELSAMGVPAIFVPLPSSADNHQLKNAELLVQRGAAKLIQQKDLSPASLKEHLQKFVDNPDNLSELSQNMLNIHQEGAAERIVDSILVDTIR